MSWTKSIDLIHWADKLDARGQLPLLIRRLIRRTVPSLISLNFPALEQIQRPGFDGEVETLQGNQFVPSGRSVWEMGVNKDPKDKADGDFQKRTKDIPPEEQKQIIFVFVTPRTWQTKEEWAKEKADNSNWKGVVALDVNDLEHWLEIAPDIDTWFTRLTGRFSPGVQDLESYWNSVRLIAEHPLVESVFTASRENEVASIANWLSGPPNSLFMRSNGLNDALDFLAALSSREGQDRLQNGLIIDTKEAWRELAVRRESMVLIAAPTLELEASDTASAVGNGHYVFLSGPRGNIGSGPDEILRRQDYYAISEALIASGFSESRARSFAKACCGSSSILKRLIPRYPSTVFPRWSQGDIKLDLAPFALVGGWTHVDPDPPPRDPNLPRIGSPPPIDVWAVTELVGCNREELDRYLIRWQGDIEPLFVQFGNNVFVASREDAWYLLGGAISGEQLKRFRDLALLVLEEDNPAFELSQDQRWMAALYGKVHSLSENLRRSIVETLALMATYPTADGPPPNIDLKGTVRWVLEQALPANAPWQRWASFGFNLTILAEGDPELFLKRVEEDLGSGDPELPKLFQDQTSSIFRSAIHSDLLWALEGLAWSPEYLSRVAVCLAKLAARDPGGTYSNRPANSLREIFLLWLWHTNASLEDRINALKAVLNAEPIIGWNLLKDLLPSRVSTFSFNTHMPRWRPWADGWSREKLRPQMHEYAIAVADLTIQSADVDLPRWSEILDGMLHFSQEITGKVLSVLEEISEIKESSQEARFGLWSELRELVLRHEQYSDAESAFNKSLRDRMAEIRDRLNPDDAVLKNHWIFDYQAELPDVDILKDVDSHDTALLERRLTALREIIAQTGSVGVFRLLDLGCDANTVGWLIGANGLLDWESISLPSILGTTDNQRLVFVNAFILSKFRTEGWKFVNQLPLAEWISSQITTFARCLPFNNEVWRWLDNFGAEVEEEYWQQVKGFLINPNLEELRIAARSLIRVGRALTAIEVLHYSASKRLTLPTELIAEVLEAALNSQNSESFGSSTTIPHAIEQLVKALQEDKDFDQARLARIEWGFLPILDPEFSKVRPSTLMSIIDSEPSFFVELVKKVYRGRNEKPSETSSTEQEQFMARNAHKLLDNLSKLPGTREDKTLDYDYLQEWVKQVKLLATECDRREVTDLTLGQFFARGSKKQEGDWPSPGLAKLMEEIGSDDFFRGFINGVLNSRGVVSRDPREGGELERREVEKYRQLSLYARPFSPKLAEAFLNLAHHYEAYAQHEEYEAQRERLGR